MQGVVLLFVAILSVVRASPLGLDSDDLSSPFRNAFRAEKVEFDKNAIAEDKSTVIDVDEDDTINRIINLFGLFGAIEYCAVFENGTWNVQEEGCIYAAFGDVHFVNVLSRVNTEEVVKALEGAAIEECIGELHDSGNVPEGGCFIINEDTRTVHLIGVYDDQSSDDIDNLANLFEGIDSCDIGVDESPEQACILSFNNGNTICLVRVLTEDNVDGVVGELQRFEFTECDFTADDNLITTDPCFWIDTETDSIILENMGRDRSNENDES